MLLISFPETRLTNIALSKSFQQKLEEIHGRIEKLAEKTQIKFKYIWNQIQDDPEKIMDIDNIILQPSLDNAYKFKYFDSIDQKDRYFIEPMEQWLELDELYKYEQSIDSIKIIKNHKALIKWHRKEITKIQFEGDESKEPPQKKIVLSYS